MTTYDDLLALSFEDRIAQAIMALLFSASHIEIVAKPAEYANNELKNGQPKATAVTNRKNTLVQDLAAARTNAALPFTRIDPVGGLRMPSGEAQASPEVLISPVGNDSEIDMDTTAVVIVGDTIYVACNFKRRRSSAAPALGKTNFEYVGFGSFPAVSIELMVAVLRDELADVRSSGNAADKARAQAIAWCKIIGLENDPTDAVSNAIAHAEMQVVNHCLPKVIDITGKLFVGVSRPCCPSCAGYLGGAGFGFTRGHAIAPKNWAHPSTFSTKLLVVKPV